jgi:mono/diheme cytochrome c family protein
VKGYKSVCGSFLALALLLAGSLLAEEAATKAKAKENYVGSELYRVYCATCHGVSAKGDGSLAAHLRFRPPDLTLIAKRDDGKWNAEKVARMIDGRDPIKGHGGPDMPVWGDAFKSTSQGFDEESVKAKVQALVAHLASLQEGPVKTEK